jgi:hypothetical protein
MSYSRRRRLQKISAVFDAPRTNAERWRFYVGSESRHSRGLERSCRVSGVAHGSTVELLADMIRAGLATAQIERVRAGGQPIEVTRVHITDAGRRALQTGFEQLRLTGPSASCSPARRSKRAGRQDISARRTGNDDASREISKPASLRALLASRRPCLP